jgi:hypothetical protein
MTAPPLCIGIGRFDIVLEAHTQPLPRRNTMQRGRPTDIEDVNKYALIQNLDMPFGVGGRFEVWNISFVILDCDPRSKQSAFKLLGVRNL